MTQGEELTGAAGWREQLAALLELQRAQVLALGEDGRRGLGDLAGAFEAIAEEFARRGIDADEGHLRDSMQVALTTLQFADAQAQRIDHLARALDRMATLIMMSRAEDTDAWVALRAELREMYTMAREREVFDRLLAGGNTTNRSAGEDAPPGVELF